MPEAQKIIYTVEQGSIFGGSVNSGNLYDKIISIENLFLAWNRFLKGKKNRFDVQVFGRDVEKSLFALQEKLQRGFWKHGAYHSFVVCDPKPRRIHKATVEDRIVHHAIVQVIEPFFDLRGNHGRKRQCRSGRAE